MQRRAKDLSVNEPGVEQLQLLPERRRVSRPVVIEHIATLQSTKQALEYACQLAGREAKDIYMDMGYHSSKWSRITTGERDLIGREIPKFNKVMGNSAYLMYLNHMDGWDIGSMRRQQTDDQRRMAELESENADLKRAFALAFGHKK